MFPANSLLCGEYALGGVIQKKSFTQCNSCLCSYTGLKIYNCVDSPLYRDDRDAENSGINEKTLQLQDLAPLQLEKKSATTGSVLYFSLRLLSQNLIVIFTLNKIKA